LGTRRVPRDLAELHRRVEQLVDAGAIEQPVELPVYVKAPTVPGEAAGWWWEPSPGGRREYLGHNVFLALRALDQVASPAP
jgi:hypothetical protein